MKKGVWAWVLLLSGGLLAADKTITGDYTVAAGGETYDNVTVSATAKVSGGMLTIADGGTLTVSSGTATFACAVAWGASTDARVTLAPASGAEAVFTGKLTGPADVEIAATDRYGIVRFSPGDGVTNDFEGDLTVTRGTFRAKGDSALGSTAGTTTCICTRTDDAYDNFIYFDGLTTSETIYLSRGTMGWSRVYTICFTGDCTFNGPILSPGLNQEYGWKFSSGITLTFNGGLGTAESPFSELMGSDDGTSNAEIVFNSSPYVINKWYWMSGVNVMNAPLLGTCGLCFRGGTYRLNVSECFARESVKRLRFESAAALTLDLAAGPQTFSYLTEYKSGYSASSVITSSAGQMFKLTNADHDSVYNGVFAGDVDFDVAGSKTVTLAGASTSAGTLTLSDTAKIVFAEGGSWSGGLAFAAGDGSQTVTLDNGGMTVTALYVAGEKMPDGTYGAAGSGAETVLSCLAGDGVLQVKTPMSTLTVEASTATYEVAAEGEAYSSVTVLGNTTFTGGALTVSGGSVTTAAGTTVCFENAVVFDSAYGVSLSPASGATLDFRGAVSGPADLEILAADKTGVVRFAPGDGVTNDFDGALTVTRGTFRAKGDSALGSTAGTTTCVCTMTDGAYDNLIYFDGLTTSETIYLSRGTIGWTLVSTVFFTADCTFNGPVMPLAGTRQKEHGWSLADGITLTFNAPLGTAEKPYGDLVGDNDGTLAAKTVFNASPYCAGNWYWKVGDVDLYAPIRGNNQWYLRGGHYRLYVADALVNDDGVSGNIRFETADPLVFELVAGDQRVNRLYEKTSGYSMASEITSSTGCRFRLCGTSPSVFAGRFTGNVDVAVEAAQTLTLSGASTSTGTLTLTNGAHVVFTDAGDWAGRIDVAGNGNETLTVNGRIRASAVTYGGEPLAPGYYGPDAPVEANRPAWLLGAGELVVTDTVGTGVWDAEGGEANLRMSSAVNWAEDEVPDGARGLTAVTFADAGTAAWIDQDVFWKAIAFSSTVPAFRLFGEGIVTLADGVTAAAPSGDSAAYEIAAPVRLYGAQTWTVPAATTLTLSGGLFGGDGERDLTLSGVGAFVFAGEAGDFRSDITVTEGASVRADSAAAFGSPEGVTKIAGTGALVLNDVTLAEPFVWRGTDASRGTFITLKPGTNVLAGPVSVENAVYFNGQSNGDRLVFSGGLDFSGMKNTGRKRFTFGWRGNAARANPFTVEIKDRPIVNDGPCVIEFYNECVCDVVVSVAGNRLTGTSATRSKIQMTRNDKNAAGEPTARLLCKVPYAFAYTDDLLLGVNVCNEGMAYCGLIDLCGNDQGFAAAYGLAEAYQTYVVDGKPQGAHSVVTSSGGPALLCSRHAEDAETWWTFTGAAGYRMEGTGGITFRTSSLSTGVLCVTNGTMTLPAGVSWRACTKAEVSGNGTLVLEHDGALGGRTEVRISENGRVHLPAGVSALAGSLVLEDGEARLGEWGSPESGAANVNACFTGTGRIRFGSTMAIIIR